MLAGLPEVTDGERTARPQYADRLLQRLPAAGALRYVVDGQVADDRINAVVAKGTAVISAVCSSMRSLTPCSAALVNVARWELSV